MKKKFRILEESLFLKKETLQHLVGGGCAPVSSICHAGKPYESCGILHINYQYCGPGVVPDGYWSGPGGDTCSGADIEFKISSCAGLGWFSEKCGSNGNLYVL